MTVLNSNFIVILCLSITLCGSCEDADEEPFIPTNEWQRVKPGQSIPGGRHVKFDMSNTTLNVVQDLIASGENTSGSRFVHVHSYYTPTYTRNSSSPVSTTNSVLPSSASSTSTTTSSGTTYTSTMTTSTTTSIPSTSSGGSSSGSSGY